MNNVIIHVSLFHVRSNIDNINLSLLPLIVDKNTSNFRPEFTSVSVDVRRTSGCRVWVRTNKADMQWESEDLSVKAGFGIRCAGWRICERMIAPRDMCTVL